MSKELEEAMEIIDAYVCASSSQGEFHKSFEIIKSALERKEKLEKAWEICKRKKVCLLGVSSFKNVKDYNDLCNHIFENKSGIKYDQLTETEFNLLKEMLEEK